jgi:signal transduction histidine kinase
MMDAQKLIGKIAGSTMVAGIIFGDGSGRVKCGVISMNILVVDDEIIQVKSLTRGLRSRGHHAFQALSAQEALNLLDNDDNAIDLVITDYAMPVMNGIELTQHVRRNHGNLPVIMMTAYGQKDLVIDALRNHCNSFIEKPFTLDQLMQEIDRVEVDVLHNTSLHQFSQMIPFLVHQINNPLTAISASAELAMIALNKPASLENHLGRIIESVRRISEINREILEVGKQANVEIEKVNINVLLDDCLTMFEDVLALKRIRVEKNVVGSDLCLWGRKFGLEQMLRNLILNSIDSMDGSAQKLLKIKAAADEDSSAISIALEDTGHGIPDALRNLIFTSYFTTKKDGTGLGLAVVKKVVEQHNGTVEVESREGERTVFKVSLPLTGPD